jgi:hypothetical protein
MADALGSGPSDRKVLRVQLPLPAPLSDSSSVLLSIETTTAQYRPRKGPFSLAGSHGLCCLHAGSAYNGFIMTKKRWIALVPVFALFVTAMFPTGRFVQAAAVSQVVVDKSFHITVLTAGSSTYALPDATGTVGDSVTPVGSYKVTTKQADPNWHWEGKAYAPYLRDQNNGLGMRWIGISLPSYGLHGTNEPFSIGKDVSHGCVRHENVDVTRVFPMIPTGTPVRIIETPVPQQTEDMVTNFLELYDLLTVMKGSL